MATKELVRNILADKLRKEKQRLKSYGTKADSFSLAHAIAPHVMALMTQARFEEIVALRKQIRKRFQYPKRSVRIIQKWLRTRYHDLDVGRKALKNWADQLERDRPWRYYAPSQDQQSHLKETSSSARHKVKSRERD